MGQKVHPIGFRLGVIGDWHSRWYAARRRYTEYLQEDLRIRKEIEKNNPEASISRIEIERGAVEVVVTAHTSRPGIVIGRGGQRVDELRRSLEHITGKRIRLNIQEIREPELDATLVARNIAAQIEHHVAYRRAMKRTIARTMQAGAKGIKVICSGRLGGAEIARRETMHDGRVPLHTLRADIDYGLAEAHTVVGRVGIKVWIYKGDILPQQPDLDLEISHPAKETLEETEEEVVVEEVKEDQTTEQSIEVEGNVTTEAS